MEILLILFAYLLGSVPTGYLVGALAGVDVRKLGSGNVGATNVARTVGQWQGILTLIGDVAKGCIPVLLAVQLGFAATVTALVAGAAFLGHLYPVFLKFRGGKGVATALGALLVTAPLATLVLAALFAVIAFLSRIASLSSMVAAAAAPLALWLLSYSPAQVALSVFFAAMIILRHRANIKRLLTGTEPKFSASFR